MQKSQRGWLMGKRRGRAGGEEIPAMPPATWRLRAKYAGVCSSCSGPVVLGEWIVWRGRALPVTHVRCR